ncbi:CNNM domain-containing protein [Mycoplasma phocoenae]|uniref:DUF21 domain-containing protein n=1 Tax=Mycoplasma phocoenae TaxID=754517 RepID=A0A858U677_9MOLU|nr:CNNM domain-containing protein [Mycoplasma phocoenae]QJG66765.1 DUF21 domain-containing protein [Mycoplasma phocoenae]
MTEDSQNLFLLTANAANSQTPSSVAIQVVLLCVLILLLITSAIVSGCETAYTSISLPKIENMIEKQERGAKLIKKHFTSFNQTLSTILFINNLVNIASSTLTAYILGSWLGEGSNLVPIISTVVLTPIIVVFSEILPKLLAKQHTIGYLKIFVYFIHVLYIISWPITFVISKLGKEVLVTNSEDEIKSIINIASDEGVLETNESILTQNALDLDSTKINSHYVKLKDVTCIGANASLKEAFEVFEKTQYSRLPIMKDNMLIGIVHLKDIFNKKTGRVIAYLKPVPTISVHSSLSSALEKMRLNRVQMAFVTPNNSSNEIKGIITIEDIIEELVGEIYDEFDNDEDIYEISLQKSRTKGSINLKTLFKQLDIENEINENEEEMEVADWLSMKLGHNIRKHDRFVLDDEIAFKVLENDDNNDNIIIEINIL